MSSQKPVQLPARFVKPAAPLPPTAPSPATSPESTRSQANARRLDAAHKHLDKMWADAEAEQIDGRRFWGKIILEVPFEGGTAQDIKASKIASDRVGGT